MLAETQFLCQSLIRRLSGKEGNLKVRFQSKARLAAGVVLIALAAVVLAGLAIASPGNGNGASAAQYAYGPAGKAYGKSRVAICHKGRTIRVAQPAVKAHLKHGDKLGAC